MILRVEQLIQAAREYDQVDVRVEAEQHKRTAANRFWERHRVARIEGIHHAAVVDVLEVVGPVNGDPVAIFNTTVRRYDFPRAHEQVAGARLDDAYVLDAVSELDMLRTVSADVQIFHSFEVDAALTHQRPHLGDVVFKG